MSKENIVVAGGFRELLHLNTVEAYDHLADKWSWMPNMINGYSKHNLVTVKDKMYVISHKNVEVFDGQKFVSLKRPSGYAFDCGAFSTGNKIHVVKFYKVKMLTYDTVKDEWSAEEPTKFAGKKRYECLIKTPKV